jgi:hypothetical protein
VKQRRDMFMLTHTEYQPGSSIHYCLQPTKLICRYAREGGITVVKLG